MDQAKKEKKEYNIVYSNGFFFPNGMQVSWGAEGVGFGGISFYYDTEQGRLICDSECMGKNFVSQVMVKLVEDSIFPDFEKHTKKVKPISLSEADSLFPFKDNVLYSPFYCENDKENVHLFQMRWRIGEEVLNVWFDKTIVGDKVEEPNMDFEMQISDNKSFKNGFVKAELWSWGIEEKP